MIAVSHFHLCFVCPGDRSTFAVRRSNLSPVPLPGVLAIRYRPGCRKPLGIRGCLEIVQCRCTYLGLIQFAGSLLAVERSKGINLSSQPSRVNAIGFNVSKGRGRQIFWIIVAKRHVHEVRIEEDRFQLSRIRCP